MHDADPHESLPPQVEKVNKFTQTLVEKLRSELSKMQSKAVNAEKENQVGASLAQPGGYFFGATRWVLLWRL